jgi:hypothetical protein
MSHVRLARTHSLYCLAVQHFSKLYECRKCICYFVFLNRYLTKKPHLYTYVYFNNDAWPFCKKKRIQLKYKHRHIYKSVKVTWRITIQSTFVVYVHKKWYLSGLTLSVAICDYFIRLAIILHFGYKIWRLFYTSNSVYIRCKNR